MMRLLFSMLLLSAIMPNTAMAQAFTPQGSYNASVKYCSAGFIAEHCSGLSVSKLFVVLADVGFKQTYPQEWAMGCREGMQDAKKTQSKYGNKTLCLTGVVLYGPHGQNVKNMLTLKK